MLVRIFDQGCATLIEAPADAVVHRGRVLGFPDMLEVRGGACQQEAVLLTESVAISAARLGLYGLKLVEPSSATIRN